MASSFHLSAVEFDAYLAERATSNAYSRPRIEVKQRALAWGRHVATRLAEIGIAADLHATDEHPSLRNHKRVDCQWVFFWRDEQAREELERLMDEGRPIAARVGDPSPHTRHAFLSLRIDARAVEVCFAIHPEAGVDVDNLRARLAASGAPPSALANEFIAALRSLPEQFQIGASAADRAPCSAVSLEVIADLLSTVASAQTSLWIGWSVPRDTATSHAEIIGEQLEDALVALAPIYRILAWSRENDHVGLEARLAGAREERARTHAERSAEYERWRKERDLEQQVSRERARARSVEKAPRKAGLATLFRTPGSPASKGAVAARNAARSASVASKAAIETEAENAPASSELAGPHRDLVESDSGSPLGRAVDEAQSSSPGPLDKGSRVRVCAGPFANKFGVVSELDGRGGARVLLGLLSTRLDLRDLEPVASGRERPAMQSSHRRPNGPLPRKAR